VHFIVVVVAHFEAQRRTAGIVHVPEEELSVNRFVGNVVCLHGRSVQMPNQQTNAPCRAAAFHASSHEAPQLREGPVG